MLTLVVIFTLHTSIDNANYAKNWFNERKCSGAKNEGYILAASMKSI